ncbi:MAG: hypothetical protein LH624_00760, partial [Cryobacterium sp.]|nr:hypothetical protein [Cryobacterium sp.]
MPITSAGDRPVALPGVAVKWNLRGWRRVAEAPRLGMAPDRERVTAEWERDRFRVAPRGNRPLPV